MHVVVGQTPPKQGLAKIYLAWELDGIPTYAVEADTTVTGAVIRWMQEQMGWLRDAGFSPVDCFWKEFRLAIFGGFKGQVRVSDTR